MEFDLHGGRQDSRHPNPGMKYDRDARVHYMPATSEGFATLRLLTKAFMIRVLFEIGRSHTRNVDNVIIYGPIHLKSNKRGGSLNHAWPDDDYFTNVAEELKHAGVFDA